MFAAFRNGRWIEYTPRVFFATDAQCWEATAIFATAIAKGFPAAEAHTYAEAIVFKRLYKGIQYEERLERLLQTFMDHAGTA